MYHFYVRKYQKFSPLEQKTMFAAYIISANQAKLDKDKKNPAGLYPRFLHHLSLLYKILEILSNPFGESFNIPDQELDPEFISFCDKNSSSYYCMPKVHSSSDKSMSLPSSDESSHITYPNKIPDYTLTSVLLQFFCCILPGDAPVHHTMNKSQPARIVRILSTLAELISFYP